MGWPASHPALRAAVPLLCALVLLAACQPGDEGLSYRAQRHLESLPDASISVEYPSFAGRSELNARIRGIVDAAIEGFKRESAANRAARAATAGPAEKALPQPRHELLIRWKSSMPGPIELSLLLTEYSWTGGANGRTVLYGINYDARRHRLLSLGELFRNGGADWLDLVTARARAELGQRFPARAGSPLPFEAGSAPTLANYDCFTFDENSVTIHFQKYQVAPGSEGTPEVTLPRDLAGLR